MADNISSSGTPDPSTVPAVPPPPGVMFDFNNPDNYKSQNIIMHSVIISIMTITVIMRVYTKAVVRKSFGIDDYFSILSWALSVTFSVLLSYATTWGFGHHIYDIPASNLIDTLKWLTISQWMYIPVVLAVKLCILFGYNRIFRIDQTTKWLIWLGVIVITLFYTIVFFILIFYCRPIERAWNPMLEGECLSYAAFPWATGIFNILSDFYILILPMPLIASLAMKLARKIRIATVFGLGLFTCIASIMRFVVSVQYSDDPDQTYVGARVLYWAVLEINLGIICSNAIVLPAFFDSSAPRSLGSLVTKLLAKKSTTQLHSTGPRSKNSSDHDSISKQGLVLSKINACNAYPTSTRQEDV